MEELYSRFNSAKGVGQLKNKLHICLSLASVLLICSAVPACAGLARMLSMGGVYLNVANDAVAAYLSPASLADLQKACFTTGFGPETLEFIIGTFDAPSSYILSYADPYNEYGVYGIYYLYENRIKTASGVISTNHNVLGYAFSKPFTDYLYVAGVVELDDYDGGDFLCFDLSVELKPVKAISMSFLMRNINEPNSDLARDISVGVALEPGKNIVFAWQLDNLQSRLQTGITASNLLDLSSVGMELHIGGIAVRAGLWRRSLCTGIGFNFSSEKLVSSVDMGYGNYNDGAGNENNQFALDTSIWF